MVRTGADLDPAWSGGRVKLNFGGVFGRMQIWVNGHFVAYQPFQTPWWQHQPHNRTFDVDVTSAPEPGQSNTIVIRLDNEIEWGGIFRRVLLWSPTAANDE